MKVGRRIRLVPGTPTLHEITLFRVGVHRGQVVVDVDDNQERRIQFLFEPYQAVKITTEDCYPIDDNDQFEPRVVVEVLDSDWIKELRASLRMSDHTANFLAESKHFILTVDDAIVEIVAWTVTWRLLPEC